MMRLPLFAFRTPRTLQEASRILDGEGPGAMLLAGGTDLLPNMKRRQQVPRTLVSLREMEGLRGIELSGSASRFGSSLTLAQVASDPRVQSGFSALAQAASVVATPPIRNMATLGGNLCLDTRCNYYNQSYEWRKAIEFCLKKDGKTCWVAPGSSKCMAVSSTDTAPALLALGARVRLVSLSGEREVAVSDLYQNDGLNFIRRRPDELLAEVLLDSLPGWKSTYWKLRRRGSFDFPVLSVAAAARFRADGTVEQARIVLGAVASEPLLASAASAWLAGRRMDQETIEQVSTLAAKVAKPLDNTDFEMTWRKRVAAELVSKALCELRGDDLRADRLLLSGGG